MSNLVIWFRSWYQNLNVFLYGPHSVWMTRVFCLASFTYNMWSEHLFSGFTITCTGYEAATTDLNPALTSFNGVQALANSWELPDACSCKKKHVHHSVSPAINIHGRAVSRQRHQTEPTAFAAVCHMHDNWLSQMEKTALWTVCKLQKSHMTKAVYRAPFMWLTSFLCRLLNYW